MKCLYQLSQNLKQSPYGDEGRMRELAVLKSQAQGLIQFAGGLRLRLGGDVYRQLSSMSKFSISLLQWLLLIFNRCFLLKQ